MWRVLVVIMLAAGLALCACSGDEGGGGPDVATLKVTGAKAVYSGRPVRLSPDGKRLMLLGDGLCVAALDGSDQKCVDPDRVRPDVAHASWSPHGTKIVFTDDYRHGHEPDLWLFDVRSGALRDLTDDGVATVRPNDHDPRYPIDLMPSWSPDGTRILFARHRFGLVGAVDLRWVDANGGRSQKYRPISCGPKELTGLAWTTDLAAWTCVRDGSEVVVADLAGGKEQLVLPANGSGDQSLLSFSPDGRQLLVDSASRYQSGRPAAGGSARVVSVAGGDPRPVASGDVAYPTWAPGGQAIAYVDGSGSLKAVAEPGGTPRELRTGEEITATDGERLAWRPGTLLVRVDGRATLLTLGG